VGPKKKKEKRVEKSIKKRISGCFNKPRACRIERKERK